MLDGLVGTSGVRVLAVSYAAMKEQQSQSERRNG
jgi:hypothetical protein